MQDGTPIIIKKVKKGGHGHHGGAWKVAYADFVTAMMAFFMVLWILGMNQEQKESIAQYFRNPYPWPGNPPRTKPNILPKNSIRMAKAGQAGAPGATNVGEQMDKAALQRVQAQVQQQIEADPELKKLEEHGDIQMSMSPEGLKIDLIENSAEGEVFFESGSANVRPKAREVFAKLAPLLKESGRYLNVDGHTDAHPMGGGRDNFDLSADRANAVRRLMIESGLKISQVLEVRGKADTEPRKPDDPFHFSNRRVTVLLPFQYYRQPVMNVPGDPSSEASSAILRGDGPISTPELPDLREKITDR